MFESTWKKSSRRLHTLSLGSRFSWTIYPIDGKVLSAEYEDGAIEYIAELGDDLILDWIRDGKIRHCSVEYDWSNLTRLNGVAPKGLQFTGLALLKNFQPGDPETTVEIWEGIIQRLREAQGKVQVEPDGHQHATEGIASEDAGDSEREEVRAQADALQTEVKAPQQALQSEIQDNAATGVLPLRAEAHEPSNEEPDALRDQIAALASRQEKLEKRVEELARQFGEAMIDSSRPKALEGYVPKDAVARELRRNVFGGVPFHWGYGLYEQNRRLRALAKGLEGGPV